MVKICPKYSTCKIYKYNFCLITPNCTESGAEYRVKLVYLGYSEIKNEKIKSWCIVSCAKKPSTTIYGRW